MEFKSKSRQADDSLLRLNQQATSGQQSLGPDLSYRQPSLLPNPHVSPRQLRLQRTEKQLTDFTVVPVIAQRQAVAPVLDGLGLQREVLDTAGPVSQRQTVQRQIEEHQASLGASQLRPGQYKSAVQRQADLQTPVAPLTRRPSTPAQWSQGGLWEVQRVAHPSKPGQTISLREQEQAQHLGVLRTVGTQLGQGFRTDAGPAVQRYAEYGEALAPFQRLGTVTGRAVVTTALMQVPVSQRQTLQQAIDDTVQRQQAQEAQDQAIIGLHSLQRQLDHLDTQSEQPLMTQIQARRGAGNPLPAELRKALELELNHDLGAVRIHDDTEADQLARKVNAVAFTTEQDIFFRAGTFNPNTRTGVELIAHEVAHTKQQAQGKAKPGIDGDAGLETEARAAGAKFAQISGVTAPITPVKREKQSALPRAPGYRRLESGTALQRATAGPALQGPAGPRASDETYIGSFKRHLQQAALKVLNDNELRMVKQRQQYAQTGATGATDAAWGDLRVLAAQQARLEVRWVQLTTQLQKLAGFAGTQTHDRVQIMIGATQGGKGRLSDSANVILDDLLATRYSGTYTPMGGGGMVQAQQSAAWLEQHARPLALIFGQIANLDDARDLLHANYPALGILSGKVGAASLAKLPNTAANNARLNAQVQPEFVKVIQAIHTMRGKVSAGDLPWKDMDLLVEQVKGELKISEPRRKTDRQSRAVLGWLDQQHNTDFWVGVATAVGLVGLTVASFFLPGSTLLLVAGLAAGGTLAAKSMFDAQKQLSVSKTQALGGKAMSSVTLEQAQQRLVMAQVEALMAAAPVVATVGGMLRVGRATRVVTETGKVLAGERAGQTAAQAGTTAQSGQAAPRVVQTGGMNSARTAGSVNVGGINAAAVSGGRIRAPVAGLYESIDVAHPPTGWVFRNDLQINPGNETQRLITYVTGPGGTSGEFVRVYDASTKTLKMDVAFLQSLPKWVGGTSKAMVPGKGIPTVTYMTMYQMKQMKIGFGALKQVKMSTIQNFDTILELERLRRAGIPLDKAILQTHSVQYAETTIIQSGHQISGAHVLTKGAVTEPVDTYMSFYEGRNPSLRIVHDALLKKYGFQRTDKMLMDFDIELNLKPLAPGQVARPLETK